MNAELLDPFAQDYPEGLTNSYNFGHATCLRFNHSGSHVAVGLVDGAVIIWDTATSGVARVLKAHTRTVQSVWYLPLCIERLFVWTEGDCFSWSADGRYLLSAARDWKCVLWDLKDGSRVRTVILDGPIWSADLNPLDQYYQVLGEANQAFVLLFQS
jgi:COMPASS component SWD1